MSQSHDLAQEPWETATTVCPPAVGVSSCGHFDFSPSKTPYEKKYIVNQTATTVIHICMKMFLFLTQDAAYFPHSVQGKTMAESVSPLVVLLEGELLTDAEPKGWVSVDALCSFGELQSSRRLFWFHVSPFVSLEKNGNSLPRNRCLLVPTAFFFRTV